MTSPSNQTPPPNQASSQRQWRLLGARRIELTEVPVPQPLEHQALLRIERATTCGTDLKAFQAGGHARMLTPPCPFGHELVGVLEQRGAAFGERLDLGQRVVVSNSSPCRVCRNCRLGRENLCRDQRYINGAFADYLLLDERFERSLHPCPEGLAGEHACLAEPLACALHCMEAIEPTLARFSGRDPARAIVMGAGPLGLLLIALLDEAGVEVISVDPNPDRLRAAVEVGARETVVYQRVLDDLHEHRQRYDVAIDASGTMQGWRNAIAAVAPGGEAVLFGGIPGGGDLPIDAHRVHYDEVTIRGLYHHRPELFPRALDWLTRHSEVASMLVADTLPLEALPEALAQMERRLAFKVALDPAL